MVYLVDTGPLVSAYSRPDDEFAGWARELFRSLPRPLFTCEAVLTEAAHFLGGPRPLLEAIEGGLLSVPWQLAPNAPRILALTAQFEDRKMDLADACLVAMSEQWPQSQVITIDAEDFRVYRRHRRQPVPFVAPPKT